MRLGWLNLFSWCSCTSGHQQCHLLWVCLCVEARLEAYGRCTNAHPCFVAQCSVPKA